jgi:tRNA-intron endonuclease, archaea type
MEKIQAYFFGNEISSNSSSAFTMNEKSFFGEKVNSKIFYSFYEVYYLFLGGKLSVFFNFKELEEKILLKKFLRLEKDFLKRFFVYSDLRKKGYFVKSGLKFGCDFRVYEKPKIQDLNHSKWLVFCVNENEKVIWQEFASKNRVSNSTKKNLLLAIVGKENEILY